MKTAGAASLHSPASANGNGRLKLVKVTKRCGEEVPYSKQKIVKAIRNCFVNSNLMPDTSATTEAAEKVADQVDHLLVYLPYPVTVEMIQDVVEQQLMALGHYDAAKAYILYRQEHTKLREEQPVDKAIVDAFKEGCSYFKGANRHAQLFQALDKFARFNYAAGRRETWPETVDRVLGYTRKHLHKAHPDSVDADTLQTLRHSLLNLETAPSMRLIQMAGPALDRCQTGVYNCSFQFLQSPTDLAEEMYLLCQGCGVGFSVEYQHSVDKWPRIKKQRGGTPDTFKIPDTTEGWCDALKFGVEHWMDGHDVVFDDSAVRKEGTILRTKGGRASGPQPLRDCLAFARSKILSRQGSRLESLDLHDINCFIHRISGVGGVRRASGISLSDRDDTAMRHCKDGQFWNENHQRGQANNSAVYDERPSSIEFMEEWMALAKSGNGERGIFNRGALKKQFTKRRQHGRHVFGTNPCVSADTWVMTGSGPRQVSDLIGKSFSALVDGELYPSKGFFKTGTMGLTEIKLANGMQIKLTGNHKLLVATHQTRKVQRTEWKEVNQLDVGDKIVLHDHRDWTTYGWCGMDGLCDSEEKAWLLGNWFGDGTSSPDIKMAYLDYWGETASVMSALAVDRVRSSLGCRSDMTGYGCEGGKIRISTARLFRDIVAYGLLAGETSEKRMSKAVEYSSSNFYCGFLRGWFDADGSVQGTQAKGVSVRLSSSDLSALQAGQRMLARLGVMSTIYEERRPAGLRLLPDGHGGYAEYECRADHELVISEDNIKVFAEVIGFDDVEKETKLYALLGGYKRELNRERFVSEVVSLVTLDGTEDVYDCQVEEVHAFDANGMYSHNCGEIVLRHKQFCNLSIAVARPQDTWEELLNKVRLAAIWGTIQSTMTNFSYIGPEWKKNCEEERLLGVDILGHLDHPMLRPGAANLQENLRTLRDAAVLVNQSWADRLGINASVAVTCGKPGGDSSVFFDAAPGFKAWHGEYFIRRCRAQANNPVAKMLKAQGVPCHTDYDRSGMLVLEFPCKSPEGALVLGGQSAIEQLEHWKTFKVNYTEHNPSVTIYVKDTEWLAVGNWVYENWDIVGGLAFAPFDGTIIPLMPYETISAEEYAQRAANFPEINWAELVRYESEDMTTASQTFACTGDKCSI